MRRLAFIKRSDERLDNCDSSIKGTRVATCFQIMRLRNVPVAERARLVVIEAVVNAQPDLLQAVGEMKIGGRVIYGISARDDERLDAASIHIAHKLPERFELVGGASFDRLRVDNRLAYIA